MCNCDLSPKPPELKIGTLPTPTLENVHTNFHLVFELGAHTGQTDRQTDMDKTCYAGYLVAA